MSWEIKAGEANVWQRLTFDKLTGGGKNSPYEYVHVSVTYDFDDPGMEHLTDFGGYFYIEFENGDRIQFYAIQKGVLAALTQYTSIATNATLTAVTDGQIYYYETVQLGPGVWLDRNIGAETGVPSASNSYSASTTQGNIGNATTAVMIYGKNIIGTDLAAVCPSGFRIPKWNDATDQSALRYIWDNAMLINGSGVDNVDGNTHTGYTNRWAIRTSTNPEIEYYYPNAGAIRIYASTNSYANYSALIWLFESSNNDIHYLPMILGTSGSLTFTSSRPIITFLSGSPSYPNKYLGGASAYNTWDGTAAYSTAVSWTALSAPANYTNTFYYNSSYNVIRSASPVRCIRAL